MARPSTERRKTVATNGGSVPTGPSVEYLRLLREEITPEEYAKLVRRRLKEGGEGKPGRFGREGNGTA